MIDFYELGADIEISIHSPNTIPNKSAFKYVNPGNEYQLLFSQMKITRLSDKHDTHCKQYGQGEAQFQMRSDCILSCYQNTINQQCNTSALIESTILVREQYLLNNRNQTIVEDCIGNPSMREMIRIRCKNWCQQECTFKYYPFGLQKVNTDGKLDHLTISIEVEHNELPDIAITQIREMVFTTFVCNFGGLLGMWLGLSFITITERIMHILIQWLKRKFNSVTIVSHNQIFINRGAFQTRTKF